MTTDKNRVDFLQSRAAEGDSPEIIPWGDVREQIDREMAEVGYMDFPENYCDCGFGFDCLDCEGALECIRSTPQQWNPGGQSYSWTSYYRCPECGCEIEIEEGD